MIEKRLQKIVGESAGQETAPATFPGGSAIARASRGPRPSGRVRLSGERDRRRERERQIHRALRGGLRLPRAGSGSQGLRALHSLSRLPAQARWARRRETGSRHRVRLCDSRGTALDAVAAFQGMESQFPGPQGRHPARAAGVSPYAQQFEQSFRSAGRSRHVAPRFRAAGSAADGVPDRVRPTNAALPVLGGRGPRKPAARTCCSRPKREAQRIPSCTWRPENARCCACRRKSHRFAARWCLSTKWKPGYIRGCSSFSCCNCKSSPCGTTCRSS